MSNQIEQGAAEKHTDRLIAAAANYAKADASDPFCFARCLCHIKSGICESRNEASKEYGLELGANAFYNAEPVPEGRTTADGREYIAIAYHNRVRP